MKTLSLLLLALALASCSHGNSDSSAPAGNPPIVAKNDKPDVPPPPPPFRELQVTDPATGKVVVAYVNEDDSSVSIAPSGSRLGAKLSIGLASANLGFLTDKDTSIRQGCLDQADDLNRQMTDYENGDGIDPAHADIFKTLLDYNRELLSYEAGYFNASLDVAQIPDALRDAALAAAKAKGFPKVRQVQLFPVVQVLTHTGPHSPVQFLDRKEVFVQELANLFHGGSSQRLVIGDLCELLNGTAHPKLVFGNRTYVTSPMELGLGGME